MAPQPPTKAWRESNKEDEKERDNKQAILDHLYFYGAKCCLHYGITSYVDGMGASCLEDDSNQRCSVCQRDPVHHPQDVHKPITPSQKGKHATQCTTAVHHRCLWKPQNKPRHSRLPKTQAS